MGAGVALTLALRYPQRVGGLLLVRPAWLAAPAPPNLDCMAAVGEYIRDDGVEVGRGVAEDVRLATGGEAAEPQR